MLVTNSKRIFSPSENVTKSMSTSVSNTLSTIFNVHPTVENVRVVNDYTIEGDVAAFVNLVDTHQKATLIMTFPTKTICSLMSDMYGTEITSVTRAVRQGAGELTNMIFGSLCQSLNQEGFRFEMAIPNVIVDEQKSLEFSTAGTTLVVPFKCEAGSFAALMVFTEKGQGLQV